jgi:hypothetical protein
MWNVADKLFIPYEVLSSVVLISDHPLVIGKDSNNKMEQTDGHHKC